MGKSELYERGLKRRGEILGENHEHSFSKIAPEVDRLITEQLFGEVWTRSQLDERTRRFIAMTVFTLGGWQTQLKSHLRAALRADISRDELIEMFHTLALYAGCPPAVNGLKVAKELFDELDAAKR